MCANRNLVVQHVSFYVWKKIFRYMMHQQSKFYVTLQVILKIHEARTKLSKLGCFKDVGVFIDTYNGPDALDDGIEVRSFS